MKSKILSLFFCILLLFSHVSFVSASSNEEIEENINLGVCFTLYTIAYPIIVIAPVPSLPFFVGAGLVGLATGILYYDISGVCP